MLLEDVELNVSKKIANFIEEKFGGKDRMLSDLWIDIEKFVEEKISPEYEAEIENPEIAGLEASIEELEDKKAELSESIADLSEKAFASAWSAAEFLEREILPKTLEEAAKNVKDKIRELRIDADDFHTWSFL